MNEPHDPNRTVEVPSVPADSLDASLVAGFAAPFSGLGATLPGRHKEAQDVSARPGAAAPTGDLPAVPGYQVLREIARGGMGRVLAALDLALDRDVALKVLLPGANADRFVRESKITARLPHPGIPPVYTLGTLADGAPFLVMKLVAGQTLLVQMQSTDRPRLLQAFTQVAQAVGFAHSKGIIHRDLKPANVMVGTFGEVQVMDWGLAKDLCSQQAPDAPQLHEAVTSFPAGTSPEQTTDDHHPGESTDDQTQAGQVLGTPAYMAPEQARGEEADARADVFALGGILCAILTGQAPFGGNSSLEVIRRAGAADLADANARLDACGADADLVALCRRCLSPSPADRPANGQAVADGLTAYLNGVQERLQSAERERAVAVAREAEQRKRRKVQRLLTAAVMVLLLVVSVGSTWAALTIRAEKELAEQNEKKAQANEKFAQEQKGIAQANEQKARTSEKLAQQQADLALNTLGLLINKVQKQLVKQPGAQQLKRELLQTALKGLEKVSGASGAKLRRNTSDAYFQMGGIARELGNSADAHKYWQQYSEMARSALKDNPENERLKLEMAWACRFLGEISIELGELKKALAYHQSALALRKELAAVPLEERMRRNEKLPPEDRLTPRLNVLQLSEEYTRIGLIHYYLGESALAEEPVLKSLALRESLVINDARDQAVWFMTASPAAGPNVLSVAAILPGQIAEVNNMRQNLARNYHLIGEIYFRLRNLKLSRLYYQKCEDTREAILSDDEREVERLKQLGTPRPPDFRLMGDLAQFHQMYGAMLFSLGAPLPEVLAHIDRAIVLSRRVLEIDRAVESRQNLARALYSRGVVAARAGDQTTAGKCFRECLEIRQELADKDVRSYRKKVDLLEILARAGKHEKAAQLAEKLRVDHQKDPEFLICAARCYAQSSLAVPDQPALRQKYLELALAALATALKQGHKDLLILETHPDLDPVREIPGFKMLLQKVSKPR
jgi:serine/threonine protein kinase/tetratricopeptide (TPR) repeat protein